MADGTAGFFFRSSRRPTYAPPPYYAPPPPPTYYPPPQSYAPPPPVVKDPPLQNSRVITIQMTRLRSGNYSLPVNINDTALTIDFVLDTGASDVRVPADTFNTLMASSSVTQSDLGEVENYRLADGSVSKSRRFTIKLLRAGNGWAKGVQASVSNVGSTPLLGQSFLNMFESWSIDNQAEHARAQAAGKPIVNKQTIAQVEERKWKLMVRLVRTVNELAELERKPQKDAHRQACMCQPPPGVKVKIESNLRTAFARTRSAT